MMKYHLILLFCLISIGTYGQTQAAFDGHKWEAPYHLPIPNDWSIERFLIPINFAPQIPYMGVEDIRFSPGWAKRVSDEYWTYAFLWCLDRYPKTDASIIAENLRAYYTGLIKSNTDSTKTGNEKPTLVTTAFKQQATDRGDVETYSGSIQMLDYMQRKMITLNCIVHFKTCKTGKTVVFYELSPQSFTHSNWLTMNKLWLDFKCEK